MVFTYENNSTSYKLHELLEFNLDNYMIEGMPYEKERVISIYPKETAVINIVKIDKNGGGSIGIKKSQYRVDYV